MDEAFGEIRSVLQQTPSADAWQALCAVLEGIKIDAHYADAIEPYVLEHLEHWPDALRIAPASWAKGLTKKTPKPAPLMALARGLDISSSRVGVKSVGYLVNSPVLADLIYLNLSHNGIKNDGAVTISKSPHIKNLETLIMTHASVGNRGAVALANCKNLQNLKTLDLTANEMIEEGCDAIQNSPYPDASNRSHAHEWHSLEPPARQRHRPPPSRA